MAERNPSQIRLPSLGQMLDQENCRCCHALTQDLCIKKKKSILILASLRAVIVVLALGYRLPLLGWAAGILCSPGRRTPSVPS